MEHTALLIIDLQNDFMPQGSLPVPAGDEIIPVINRLIPRYPLVVATQDWHPPQHKSFASNHPGGIPFQQIQLDGYPQVLWPEHCVANTPGAMLHPELDQTRIAAIFRKGMAVDVDSYSAFYDCRRNQSTGLAAYLRSHQIKQLHITGLAADYCVYYSIKDALEENFFVTLIEPATRAIDSDQSLRQTTMLLQQRKFTLAHTLPFSV